SGSAHLRGDVPPLRHRPRRATLLRLEADRAGWPIGADAAALGGCMKAVILAAGRGGRLRAAVGDRPKCLARIGSRTLIERQIQTDLLAARYEDAMLMAARAEDETFSAEEMKVQVRRGRVIDMDKAMPESQADGENIGIVKFGADGAAVMVDALNQIVAAGGVCEWLPRAFVAFVDV